MSLMNDWFIQKLNSQLVTFDDDTCELLLCQQSAFELCCALIQESKDSLKKRSRQRRSVVIRARSFLANIFHALGREVFLLCSIAVSISKLSEIASGVLLPEIRKWWETQSCPLGVTTVATALCDANSIGTFISLFRSPQTLDSRESVSS